MAWVRRALPALVACLALLQLASCQGAAGPTPGDQVRGL
jgi:hypothetical protein